MEIIPAIDIIDGKCVRLTKGDYTQKTEYFNDPLEVAKIFEQAGINRLHLVDLDGARQKRVINIKTLETIALNTSLTIDFGGGVKTREDLERVFNAGATQVTAGSIAAKDPDEVRKWLHDFGGEKIILGADVLYRKIMVSGWQQATELELFAYLKDYIEAGVHYAICTDISKDGMLGGPAFELYEEILKEFPTLKLIASGGVSNLDDLHKLKTNGLFGAIVGKAYYENKITLEELKEIIDAD
jgi:phosphoribosylformimino-5-aminoimidazole carboxamide ribotide isomerase